MTTLAVTRFKIRRSRHGKSDAALREGKVFSHLGHAHPHQYVLQHEKKEPTRYLGGGSTPSRRASPDPKLTFALEALPDKLRLPLVLCYSEGRCYAEDFADIALPLATVRNRIHRAKAELRKELDAQ